MKSRITILIATLLVMLVVTERANAQDCYQSSILSPSPFMGNNEERSLNFPMDHCGK